MTIELRFLGTGDAFGTGGRFQACVWLRSGAFRCLIDCGATSLLAMRAAGLDPNEVDAVVISHFHGDHFGGVPYLVLEGQFRGRTRPLVIAGPTGIRDRTHAAMEEAFRGSSGTRQRFAVEYVELASDPRSVGAL